MSRPKLSKPVERTVHRDERSCGVGERVRLERPTLRHARPFLQAVHRSHELHRRWVSPPTDRHRFTRYVNGLRKGNRVSFLVVTESNDIAGVIEVSEIVRGRLQSAYLGYYAFQPYVGRGLMRQGLGAVISHAFSELKLHRLEANIQPDNARSIALVKSLGFQLEGLSPRYLKVCGRWRDHERWALLAEYWRPRKRPNTRPPRTTSRRNEE